VFEGPSDGDADLLLRGAVRRCERGARERTVRGAGLTVLSSFARVDGAFAG